MASDPSTSNRFGTGLGFELAFGAWTLTLLVTVPAAVALESQVGIALGFLVAPAAAMAAYRLA